MARKSWVLGPPLWPSLVELRASGSAPAKNHKRSLCTSKVRGKVVEWGSSVASHRIQIWLTSDKMEFTGRLWGSHRLQEKAGREGPGSLNEPGSESSSAMLSEHYCLFVLAPFTQDSNSSKRVQGIGLVRVPQPLPLGQGVPGTLTGNSTKQILKQNGCNQKEEAFKLSWESDALRWMPGFRFSLPTSAWGKVLNLSGLRSPHLYWNKNSAHLPELL